MRKLFRLRPEFTLDDLHERGINESHVSREIGRYYGIFLLFPGYSKDYYFPGRWLEEVTRVTLPSGETARIIGTEGDRVTVAPEWAVKTFSLEEVR